MSRRAIRIVRDLHRCGGRGGGAADEPLQIGLAAVLAGPVRDGLHLSDRW